MNQRKTVVMGAGPSGLSAGYELSKAGENVVIFEKELQVGGISKTINYKDSYFDLGGHRFFTKISEVNSLWFEVLGSELFIERPRLSRIYYNNRFFYYPLRPLNAIVGMGILNIFSIVLSLVESKLFPRKPEISFEDWVSNRFGWRLYSIFFKTYTEKVWGIPCSRIGADWAEQRIKGLSLIKAVINAFFKGRNKVKTLIDSFHYPVLGPGMMYQVMADKIERLGGQVVLNSNIIRVNHDETIIKSIEYEEQNSGIHVQEGTHFISSIPITELVQKLNPPPDDDILKAAQMLQYRSFIVVDLIVNKKEIFPDNWIYIHSSEVKMGRIQNFKNWSSRMVADPEKTALGVEYFCNEDDELWRSSDQDIAAVAKAELVKLKFISGDEVEDFKVVRVPKAYPMYHVGYEKYLEKIKNYLARFKNLQLVGRYGMFKYNNMDHSIISGLYAARNIMYGKKYDLWEINTDKEYQEESR